MMLFGHMLALLLTLILVTDKHSFAVAQIVQVRQAIIPKQPQNNVCIISLSFMSKLSSYDLIGPLFSFISMIMLYVLKYRHYIAKMVVHAHLV